MNKTIVLVAILAVFIIYYRLNTPDIQPTTMNNLNANNVVINIRLESGYYNGKVWNRKHGYPIPTKQQLQQDCTLIVKFVDARVMDQRSIVLAKHAFVAPLEFPLTITLPYPPQTNDDDDDIEVTIQAVLNIGWDSRHGEKWIREGDWHTDTAFHIRSSNEINNIYLVHTPLQTI